MSLYAGLPIPVQILFWIALVLILSSFLTVVSLQLTALRARWHRLPDADEADFLWVFLVPALNEEVTIADSVARLHECEASNKLIIAIDDGSDDSTPQVLAGLDVPTLNVLRRDPPNARVGKAAALNAAWQHLHELLLTPRYRRWTTEQVIVVVIDADGRLAREAPRLFARHFADPATGGVQSLVRIYNRRGWLTWAQDVEFSIFGWVYQLGRSVLGSANMGGNGQANRLAALDDVAVGSGPWRNRLTEDQDIGVRMLARGWHGRQDVECVVEQQGVSNLRRLYRQRTRWSQGGWEAISLITGVHRMKTSIFARIDAAVYLLTPIIQTVIAAALVVAVVIAIAWDAPFFSASMFTLILILSLSFGPGLLGLMSRGKGIMGLLTALVLLIPYTLYSWIIFPVVIRAGVRWVAGRSAWDKTAREPLEGPATNVE